MQRPRSAHVESPLLAAAAARPGHHRFFVLALEPGQLPLTLCEPVAGECRFSAFSLNEALDDFYGRLRTAEGLGIDEAYAIVDDKNKLVYAPLELLHAS